MSALCVSLFGKFHAQRGEQVLTELYTRKMQELFCYLLLYRDRRHPRETLANLLWGDNPTPQSKKCLRQALWQLQGALDAKVGPDCDRVLRAESGWVQLDSSVDLQLDVAVFEQAFACVSERPDRALDDYCVQLLQDAVQLYQGDLLDGWYQDWCLYERERLQNMYLAMLDKLMGHYEARGQYDMGLIYGARILRYDRARESTHRRLMRLYYLAGDRTAALRQYERCRVALIEELGVSPAKRTLVLYEQIRADQPLDDGAPPAPPAAPPDTANLALHEAQNNLQRLLTILADVEAQVQQAIHAVEVALNDQR